MTTSTPEETVLHIFKRRMGLTKRGSYDNEALTVSDVSVNQTDHFTVHEMSEFVTLVIPTAQILQTKVCVSKPEFIIILCFWHFLKYNLCASFPIRIHYSASPSTSKPCLFYRPAQTANISCSRSTGWMLCSPSKRQITKCTGAWRTHCRAQVSVLLMNTVKLKWWLIIGWYFDHSPLKGFYCSHTRHLLLFVAQSINHLTLCGTFHTL